MKTVILNDKVGQEDLYKYGKQLMAELEQNFDVIVHTEINPDFSNIPELTDSEEKLILFNPFSFDDAFAAFTKHLPQFKNIKYMISPYSAYDGLDLELLKKMGIKYRNNGGANAKSVAQYATTTMFMLLGKFPMLMNLDHMADGTILGEEFHQKTAGIIGMGNVGKELLNNLNGLGINTVYFNREKKQVDAQLVTIGDIFKQDIVFITIATNKDTKELLGNIHEMIQPHNYLIDVTASEDLYDKEKMVPILNEDKLKGYALEVFDPKSFTATSDKNFLKTPHIAWCTIDAEKRTVQNYLTRALKILRGETDEIDFIV